MYPLSPQPVPHEFFMIQQPFVSSQPTNTTAWSMDEAVLALNTPPE
jgi:hypothetical protein